MNYSNYVVFDFETDGLNPQTCQPVQIAATVLNPRTLEPYDGAMFQSYMKPNLETVDVSALEVNKITLETLQDAPPPKIVWKQFAKFCSNYDVIIDKSVKMPIPVGYNINSYDMVIVKRLNEELKQKQFLSTFTVDVLLLSYIWFENNNILPNLKFDSIRNLLKMSHIDAHNAIQDVKQTAQVFKSFMEINRKVNRYVKWS